MGACGARQNLQNFAWVDHSVFYHGIHGSFLGCFFWILGSSVDDRPEALSYGVIAELECRMVNAWVELSGYEFLITVNPITNNSIYDLVTTSHAPSASSDLRQASMSAIAQ